MTTPPPVEEVAFKGYDPLLVRRLTRYFQPYQVKMLVSLVLMLVNSAAAVAGPYLVKMAVDSGMEAGSRPDLARTVWIYLAAISVQ